MYNSKQPGQEKLWTSIKDPLSIAFLVPAAFNHTSGKQTDAFTQEYKEQATYPNSEVYNHINSCEQFQHFRFFMELSPYDQNSDETLQISLCDFMFNNCAIIDKADH